MVVFLMIFINKGYMRYLPSHEIVLNHPFGKYLGHVISVQVTLTFLLIKIPSCLLWQLHLCLRGVEISRGGDWRRHPNKSLKAQNAGDKQFFVN